jgi:hypothetical protein
VRVTIPAPYRETVRAAALRKYIRHRKFPRDIYYEAIEAARKAVAKFNPGNEVLPDQIVDVLAAMIKKEEALTTFVMDNGYDISDPENWVHCLEACAWLVIQQYTDDRFNGDWDINYG